MLGLGIRKSAKTGLRTEMKQSEDGQVVEKVQCHLVVQSATDESREFDRQYNRVKGCWRTVEERLKRFESEYPIGSYLLQEAKNPLQEKHLNDSTQ